MVAALTDKECRILDSVNSDSDRYPVYRIPGMLAWVLELEVGDTVLARLPPRGGRGSSTSDYTYADAIIRWCGYTRHVEQAQYLFGVEITVSVKPSQPLIRTKW